MKRKVAVKMNNLNIYNEKKFDVEETIWNRTQYEQDSFYICCLSDVIKKYDQWIEKIPRVHPFYAVKCNDDTQVLKTLAALGTGFDCASKQEIAKVLSIGVAPSRIIFAHTTKIAHHIQFAKEVGVDLLTFDNEDELHKVKKFHPMAKYHNFYQIKYRETGLYGTSFNFDSKLCCCWPFCVTAKVDWTV